MPNVISADSNSGTTLNLSGVVYVIRATYTTNAFTALTLSGNVSPVIFQDGGSVFNVGTGVALLVQTSTASVTVNAGSSLVSDGAAIETGGNVLKLVNYGLIKSTGAANAINGPGDGSSIDNYGEISSSGGHAYSAAASSASTIDNHGTFRAATTLAALDLADGNDVVNNHATIVGQTRLRAGTDSVFNSGTMLASVAIDGLAGGGDKTITNTGFIGTTSSGGNAIALLGGTDLVLNFGTIQGAIHLGDGSDGYQAFDGATISAGVFGEGGGDNLIGNNFDDTLDGGDADDTLTGKGGDDNLVGGAGSDTMSGGFGDDTFSVDDLGDVINEYAGQGSDTVGSAVSYTLVAGVDVERMVNTAAGGLTLTGNELAQSIYGHLTAADTLAGGGSADTMFGAGGNDTYVVDNAGDIIDESFFGSGTDTVQSSVTFSLADALHAEGAVENLTLTGSAAINGTGNALANIVTGNAAANTLEGGVNNDTLLGLAGNDTYVLGAEATGVDTVTDAAGTDTITSTITRSLASFAAIENLTLLGTGNGTGNALANIITGSAAANILDGGLGADTLLGNAGNDTLIGGAGVDTLTGGANNDFFVFNAPLSAVNRDIVTDFSAPLDTFRLENAVMTKLGVAGALKATAFFAGTAAHDADDRIVYNKATGILLYDSNGNLAGGVTQLATLTTLKPTLTAADFIVI